MFKDSKSLKRKILNLYYSARSKNKNENKHYCQEEILFSENKIYACIRY